MLSLLQSQSDPLCRAAVAKVRSLQSYHPSSYHGDDTGATGLMDGAALYDDRDDEFAGFGGRYPVDLPETGGTASSYSSSEPFERRRSSFLTDLFVNMKRPAAMRSQTRRVSFGSRARHVILKWRLQRPYLAYCLCCSVLTAFLFCWNFAKGMQNHWNLPQWKHHRWEECLEVTIGACMAVETLITLRVLGPRDFFRNIWCVFDFCVMLLTVVSIGYGLVHLGKNGEICEADIPLLMLRFVLQPVRVLAACASTCRVRNMQEQVNELQIDFGALPAGGQQELIVSQS